MLYGQYSMGHTYYMAHIILPILRIFLIKGFVSFVLFHRSYCLKLSIQFLSQDKPFENAIVKKPFYATKNRASNSTYKIFILEIILLIDHFIRQNYSVSFIRISFNRWHWQVYCRQYRVLKNIWKVLVLKLLSN